MFPREQRNAEHLAFCAHRAAVQHGDHHMISLFLTFAPTLLLLAGVCALAVWAARQCDPQSALIERLTGETEQR